MIRELEKQEFREMNAWSYSRLSLFKKDRLLYKKKYIDNESVKQTSTRAMIMGNLVDLLISAPDEFDDNFICRPFSVPKPQLKKYTEYLVECYTNPSILGDETAEEYAYRKTEIKGSTLDKIKQAFDKECRDYYEVLVESLDKPIISPNERAKADQIITALKNNTDTQFVFEQEKQKYLFNEDLNIKFCPDFIEGNLITDLKVVTNSPCDFQNNIRMFNYDIQGAVFSMGIDLDEVSYNNNFQFLVVNSEYPEYPVIWKFSNKDFTESKKMVEKLMIEAKLREETNNWYQPINGIITETNLYE